RGFADLAGGAGARAIRQSRERDRAGNFPYPDADGAAGRDTAELGGVGAVSQSARRSRAIRGARPPYGGEPLPQRRGDPPRRRAAHGAEVDQQSYEPYRLDRVFSATGRSEISF